MLLCLLSLVLGSTFVLTYPYDDTGVAVDARTSPVSNKRLTTNRATGCQAIVLTGWT